MAIMVGEICAGFAVSFLLEEVNANNGHSGLHWPKWSQKLTTPACAGASSEKSATKAQRHKVF